MSRKLSRSVVADLCARLIGALLFVILLPFILFTARKVPPGPTRSVPFSAPLPRDRMSEPS